MYITLFFQVKLTVTETGQVCDKDFVFKDKLLMKKLNENEQNDVYILDKKYTEKYMLNIVHQIPDKGKLTLYIKNSHEWQKYIDIFISI